MFVCALLPPTVPLTYDVMGCGVHMPMQNCVCAGGGGGHMLMHALGVLVAISVCAMHSPTHCDFLLCSTLLYQSRLERFVF